MSRLAPVCVALAVSALMALPLRAEPSPETARLFDALGMAELLPIMRDEGFDYAVDLREDLFPDQSEREWTQLIGDIYDVERLARVVQDGLSETIAPESATAVADFFETEAGRRIIGFEIAARRALLDEAVEEAASAAWMDLQDKGGARWDLLTRFEEANDLIEQNVAGAMTSNYAFYVGLVEGGAMGFEMTESEILADVWDQEGAIRDDTTDWVFSFTALAYQPLSDRELDDYVAFSRSDEGQALNAALFSTFNELFADISLRLGRSAARFLSGQDI